MIKRSLFFPVGFLLLLFSAALGTDETALMKLTDVVVKVPSPTGYEEPLVEVIQGILPPSPQAKRDNLGSLYWKREGRAARIIVCTPMDEVGYFVSGINPQGYLRIDKAVFGAPLIDSYHLGHPMLVWTEKGPVEGVLALPSLHILSSEVRQEFQQKPSLELAYLDIGAHSQADVLEKGVAMLDAVTPWREVTRLAGSKIAGYSIGLKLCTALVLDAARKCAAEVVPSNPAFVWMAQTKISLRRSRPPSALGAFRALEELEKGRVVVVDVFPCDDQNSAGIKVGSGPVIVYARDIAAGLVKKIQEWAADKGLSVQAAPDHRSPVMQPFWAARREAVGLFMPVKFSKTPSEVVDTRDAEALGSLLSILCQEGGL